MLDEIDDVPVGSADAERSSRWTNERSSYLQPPHPLFTRTERYCRDSALRVVGLVSDCRAPPSFTCLSGWICHGPARWCDKSVHARKAKKGHRSVSLNCTANECWWQETGIDTGKQSDLCVSCILFPLFCESIHFPFPQTAVHASAGNAGCCSKQVPVRRHTLCF